MLAFLRRPRTQRLREYERQLAVQVTVFAIATISETERHDLNRGRPREPIDRSAPRERGADAVPEIMRLALRSLPLTPTAANKPTRRHKRGTNPRDGSALNRWVIACRRQDSAGGFVVLLVHACEDDPRQRRCGAHGQAPAFGDRRGTKGAAPRHWGDLARCGRLAPSGCELTMVHPPERAGQTVGWKNGVGIRERGRFRDLHAKSRTSGAVDPPRTNGEAENGRLSD